MRRCLPILSLVSCIAFTSPAWAVKVVTYNAMIFKGPPDTCDVARLPALRTVTRALDADILCVQELTGNAAATGYSRFLTYVLNDADGPGGNGRPYTGAPYFDGQGDGWDNGLYYRADTVEVLGGWTIPTASNGGVRDWTLYRLRLLGYHTAAGEIWVYICHLAAGDAPGTRTLEAQVYRAHAEAGGADHPPPGAHIIVCGDFNIQGETEPAWNVFTRDQAPNIGRLYDPLNPSMTPDIVWHDNCSYALQHTQSPQTDGNYPSNGCAYITGGIDDRFDFLLISNPLRDGANMEYTGGTYRTFGNDGQHCNKAMIEPPTIPEGGAMAAALWQSADHLPVTMELTAPALIEAPAVLDFGTVAQGSTATATLTVRNAAPLPGQFTTYHFEFPAGFSSNSTGTYLALPGQPPASYQITMDTSTPGAKGGYLTIVNGSPEEPNKQVLLTGMVGGGALRGDMNNNGDVEPTDISPFVSVLLDPAAATAGQRTTADMNTDGYNDGRDLSPFVQALLATP